jgi:GxxExxY protein
MEKGRTVARFERMLEHEALTERIIGAAIEVHRTLGAGFLETIYEAALDIELRDRGLLAERQIEVPVLYKGRLVGLHRLDMFVEREIVVELKAVKEITPIHYMVVRSYLRALGKRHGLLLNFASVPLDIRRVSGA